jgi:CRP-like cAMP-binding protein
MTPPNHVNSNRLIAAFSQADRERLLPDLSPVSLSLREVLYEVGAPLEYVYFIEQGLASVLTSMADGSGIEVGMIGIEGMVGAAALLGDEVSAQQFLVQVPGNALRMNAARCRATFDQSAGMRAVVHRFVIALLNLGAQTAACNRLHSIEQRLARWLLMASDRIGSDTMPMTHEFLSSMLGVRRSGVTIAAGDLQRSGLIRYRQGQLSIVNREGLEASACECYGIDHDRLAAIV